MTKMIKNEHLRLARYIINTTESVYGIPTGMILGARRDGLVAEARQVAMLIAREYLGNLKHVELAKIFKRSHATVLSNIAVAKFCVGAYSESKDKYNQIKQRINDAWNKKK